MSIDLFTEETDVEVTPFIRSVAVVALGFLDEEFVLECLAECGYGNDGQFTSDAEMGKYTDWNTGWNFSAYAKGLSDHLVSKGVPKDIPILIQHYN